MVLWIKAGGQAWRGDRVQGRIIGLNWCSSGGPGRKGGVFDSLFGITFWDTMTNCLVGEGKGRRNSRNKHAYTQGARKEQGDGLWLQCPASAFSLLLSEGSWALVSVLVTCSYITNLSPNLAICNRYEIMISQCF